MAERILGDGNRTKSLLLSLGSDPKRIEDIATDTKISEVLVSVPAHISFFEAIGVDLSEYIGNLNLKIQTTPLYMKLTSNGAERIREIGKIYNDEERAKELVQLGTEKGIVYLCAELTFRDAMKLSDYELSKKEAKAAA